MSKTGAQFTFIPNSRKSSAISLELRSKASDASAKFSCANLAKTPNINIIETQLVELQRLHNKLLPFWSKTSTPIEKKQQIEILSERVATAHIKKALYWSAKGRKYKSCKRETASGDYECPKCGLVGLRKAIYKKVDSVGSIPLYGCPSCMFLIRRDDIL